MTAWDDVLATRDVILLTLSSDVLTAIENDVAAPSAAKWIRENEARGLPASELYQLVSRMAQNGS